MHTAIDAMKRAMWVKFDQSLPAAAAQCCDGCGEPFAWHYDTSGCLWIGCKGAITRRSIAYTNQQMREGEQ